MSAQKPSSKSAEKSRDSVEIMVNVPSHLLVKLHAFIAHTNNHLMSISVCGDNILKSAEIMKLAMELHKELERIENGDS